MTSRDVRKKEEENIGRKKGEILMLFVCGIELYISRLSDTLWSPFSLVIIIARRVTLLIEPGER